MRKKKEGKGGKGHRLAKGKGNFCKMEWGVKRLESQVDHIAARNGKSQGRKKYDKKD